jgi:parvulin-like peptidyl-prolyl isomerase
MIANQFKDSLGVFNRAAYDRAVADPQNRQAWIQVENDIRRQRRLEKLQSLLFATTRVTPEELRQRFMDRTITMEGEYALFDPNRFVPDSMVQVSDADLQRYYNANQDEYKVRAARKLKYVFFSLAPTSDDSASVRTEMNRILDQAKSGMDFVELAKTYSDEPVNDTTYVKHGELSRQMEDAVFSAKKGQIVGPISDFGGYHLAKVLDERKGSADYVRASHILLSATAGSDTTAIIQRAKELLRKIRNGESFEALAREYSDDPGSKTSGGDLGWTGRGGWVKPFEQAAFGAKVGEVVGPIRTQFGWHIIKVTGRDNRELRIATLTMKIKASAQSSDATYQRAQDFLSLAKDEGFEKSADLSSYQVRETQEFTKGGFIPGIGISDAVMNFAFSEKLNAIGDPISVPGGVGVFKISGIREEGVRPLEEIKNLVRNEVVREKKMQKLRERVDAFYQTLTPNSDLLTAAKALPDAVAQTTGPFKTTDTPQGVGKDYAFIGTAVALKPGEISKPFEGTRGYYILKLTSKLPFDSTQFAKARSSLADELLQEKRNRLFSDWLTELRDKAEIEDLRDRFYR